MKSSNEALLWLYTWYYVFAIRTRFQLHKLTKGSEETYGGGGHCRLLHHFCHSKLAKIARKLVKCRANLNDRWGSRIFCHADTL